MQLTTILTLLTPFLALTTANPIALPPGISPQANQTPSSKPVLELITKGDACFMKMHAFDVCKGKMARVDKKRKCHELKANKLYSGKACGKGQTGESRTWQVNTDTRYGNGIKLEFDDGGSRVDCNIKPKGPMAC
ncbi:MAG: hypothetical protein Q9192_009068 [Flavoplaca navasiana]